MRTSICLLAFLAIASVAMAVVGPVTSITTNNTGASPNEVKILTGITVGADTFPVAKLRTGTTTKGTTPVPTVDDLDMNTGTGGSPGDTVNFGGKDFFSTNGNKPDFFYFEGAGTGTGNPDDITVAPIFTDGTVGMAVAWPTTMAAGWGNCGILTGGFQNGQTIAGVCWDITDMKDASGNFLSANAVIKGIRIGPSTVGIDPSMFIAAVPLALRGQAHTPVPGDSATMIDPTTTTQVSWFSPEQDNLGALKDDPNIVSVDGYDVRFGTDPNTNNMTPVFTTSQSYPVSLAYMTNYYWRVDAKVTWNSIAVTGKINDTITGYDWKFRTQDPTLTFNGVITLQSLLPAALSGSVVGFANPISSVNFSILNNDLEYPAGAIATVTNTTAVNTSPTATLTTDKPGKYKVKLAVSDGTTALEKTTEVLVYISTDDCTARKAAGGWVSNYYDATARPGVDDYDEDCIVNLGDFAELAKAWLNNTGLLAQQTYTGAVVNVPKAVFDARIEAESVSQTDPDAVSNFPVTDAVGIRISAKTQAIGGGKILGYTVNGTPPVGEYAQYTINIPAAGTYDLHLYAAIPTTTGGLDFGTAANPTLYGSVAMLPGTGYTDYFYRVYPGALTFTAAGPTTVRITWNTQGSDLDWFTLVKQ